MFDPMLFKRPWPPRRPRLNPRHLFSMAFAMGFAIRDLMQEDSLLRRGMGNLRDRLERLVAPSPPTTDTPPPGDEA